MFPYKAGRPFRYDPAAKKGKTPPACPGEYRIRNARRELQYIGETNDLSRRMKEHIASGKLPLDGSVFDYMPADGRSASRTRRAHEQRSIKKHAPPGNKSRGGEGRPARRRKSGASKPHDRSPSPQKAPGILCWRQREGSMIYLPLARRLGRARMPGRASRLQGGQTMLVTSSRPVSMSSSARAWV